MSVHLRSRQRVAVVGSGPAAFYAVQRLLAKRPEAAVDIFEKLPVPYGLSRFGVAPDHPEVKNCQERFAEFAQATRFFGNVEIGKDLSVAALMQRYSAVLFAYGARLDRGLDLPGARHPAVRSAREFVGWYNGDPCLQHSQDLRNVETVSIIGNGNVALDVARILLRDPRALANTDITAAALETLSTAKIKRVNIFGRRGVLHSAFTNKELRELLTEPGVAFEGVDLGDLPKVAGSLGRAEKRKLGLLEAANAAAPPATAAARSWSLEFLRSPQEFVPASATRLDHIRFAKNTLAGPVAKPHAIATGEVLEHQADLAFLSIGYKGAPLPGLDAAGIPFDAARGIIPTTRGRVPGTNAFAAGWIKNGPQGVIASTMMDGYAVGEEIAALLAAAPDANDAGAEDLLRGHDLVDWQRWCRIDAAEIERGRPMGKPREKFTSVEEMLAV